MRRGKPPRAAAQVVSSLLNSYYGKLAKERSTIEKALSATQEVSFPMVLLQARSEVPDSKRSGCAKLSKMLQALQEAAF